MTRVREVVGRGHEVVVRWDDDGAGDVARFHACWLRDNCRCTTCRHPSTGELVLDQLRVPADVTVVNVAVAATGDGVEVRWDDGHRGRFGERWLHDHRYDLPEPNGHVPASWGPDDPEPLVTFTWDDVVGDGAAMLELLDTIHRRGLAVVRASPVARDTVVDLVDRIGFVLPSNFGFTYDIDDLPDPRSNAHTALGLVVHTDLPHHDVPPAVQFLHCRRNTVAGGTSTLVDARRVVEVLRRDDPRALATLVELPVAFRYADETADHRYEGPAVELDRHGGLRLVRFAPNVVAPLRVPYERMPELRRAYQFLARTATDPALVVRRRLEPGDILINDNHRVLHGRDAFDPASGRRLMQGCYMDGSELHSRRRVLSQEVAR
jgi:gamma-butyrobetaine dioxygenase